MPPVLDAGDVSLGPLPPPPPLLLPTAIEAAAAAALPPDEPRLPLIAAPLIAGPFLTLRPTKRSVPLISLPFTPSSAQSLSTMQPAHALSHPCPPLFSTIAGADTGAERPPPTRSLSAPSAVVNVVTNDERRAAVLRGGSGDGRCECAGAPGD